MIRFFLRERNMLIAVAISALVICALYFPSLKHNAFLHYLDFAFVVLFLIEAIVKVASMGWKDYFLSNWNKLDFFIVVFSIPTLLAIFLPFPSTSALKLLRLMRFLRLARLMTFIPHMEMIISGLGRALKASVFVLLLLMFMNFLLALFTCHFYGEIAPEYFGDPLISSYSIFQMFTVEGWNEIPQVIAERSSDDLFAGLARFYFVLVVLAGGIFGMSLANAVFVDEMTMDNNIVLEDKIDKLEKNIEELKRIVIEQKK